MYSSVQYYGLCCMILLTVSYTFKSQSLLNRDWNLEIIDYDWWVGGRGCPKKTPLNGVDSCEENTAGDRTSS